MTKTSYGDGTSKDNDYGEQTNNRLLRYEDKIKKMDDIIKIASDSTEKYLHINCKFFLANINKYFILDYYNIKLL